MNMIALPSLQTLRIFESAYRLGSFTKAGEELGISQGAVSQNIKTLEIRLGFLVFFREGRSIIPTPSGTALRHTVSESLSRIESVIAIERQKHKADELIISAHPGFAIRWMFPRLTEFERALTNIKFTINTVSAPTNFALHHAHCAIDYAPREQNKTYLFDEHLFPVCSPEFAVKSGLADKGKKKLLQCLPNLTLLTDSSQLVNQDQDNWTYWANQVGVELSGQVFKRHKLSNITLQLAELGHGVALGRTSLVMDAIQSGRLVQLFPSQVRNPYGYTLQVHPGFFNYALIRDFEKLLKIQTLKISQFEDNSLSPQYTKQIQA